MIDVELVVLGVARLEVGGARRHVHVLAVDASTRSARPANAGRRCRNARSSCGFSGVLMSHSVEARRRHAEVAADLVGDAHHVAEDFDRVRPHLACGSSVWMTIFGFFGIGHVDRREVLRRAFVAQPHDAAAVLRLLHAHAFADAAEPAQFVLRDELHVQAQGLVGLLAPAHCFSHFSSVAPHRAPCGSESLDGVPLFARYSRFATTWWLHARDRRLRTYHGRKGARSVR